MTTGYCCFSRRCFGFPGGIGRLTLFYSALVFLTGELYASLIPCSDRGGVQLRAIGGLHERGWGGDDGALLEAMEAIERLGPSRREAPLAQAYYGSACVARARMVSDRQKPRWLRRGAGELDAAVGAAPEDVHVRFLRAITFAVLPRLAGRMETARSDFSWLVGEARNDLELGDECRQAVFYHAGAFALRNRDWGAVELLTLAKEIGPTDGIEWERVNRMLRLAQAQVPREDEQE